VAVASRFIMNRDRESLENSRDDYTAVRKQINILAFVATDFAVI